MKKYLFLISITILLLGCQKKDATYYWENLTELQNALQKCPQNPPKELTCAQLQTIGKEAQALSYELQSNVALFGKSILTLQEKIYTQEKNLQSTKNEDMLLELEKNRIELQHRIAIAKHFESPGR